MTLNNNQNIDNLFGSLAFLCKERPVNSPYVFGKTTAESDLYKKLDKGMYCATPLSLLTPSEFSETSGNSKKNSLFENLNDSEGFVLFVTILNQHVEKNRCEIDIRSYNILVKIAKLLNISENDFKAVIDFYLNDVPYTDKINALYVAHEKANKLLKSKGINLLFTAKGKENVFYLKYFEKYETFLSKTFTIKRPYNSITENIEALEINIVDSANYFMLGLGIFSFEELIEKMSDFVPFQSVQVLGTDNTPDVLLDVNECIIVISGPSTPLSPNNYFDPIYEWLTNYKTYGNKPLNIHLNLEYYNTYTTKFLLRMICQCNEIIHDTNKMITVYWYYPNDDDDTFEFGKHLQTKLGKSFKFIAHKVKM